MPWAEAEAEAGVYAVAVAVPDLDPDPEFVELASHPGRKSTTYKQSGRMQLSKRINRLLEHTLDLQDARSPQDSCIADYSGGMLAG